jgi:PucR family transcriptional regulator, purine catabolism regulatory protein
MRRVHQKMVDAALTGDGFDRMAELASEEIGRPVAIVVPGLDVALAWPEGHDDALAEVAGFTAARVSGARATIPESIELVVPVSFSDTLVGGVAMVAAGEEAEPDASEFLHLAAMAAATAFALEEARERDQAAQAGGVLARLADGSVSTEEALRVARAAGFDPAGGVMVLVTDATARPHEAVALVESEVSGALVEVADQRVYALIPAGRGGPPGALGTVEGLAARLRAYGPTGTSSRYAGADELGRAVREAELVLEALAEGSAAARELEGNGGSGVYRLLFRVLASRPEEVASFYEDTIAPLVRHDEHYRGDLLQTLEAYLAHDCNMNSTARAIYAHRHTVAYRLERVKELTGLDPAASEDRERLGLGLKALRIVDARARA